MTDVELIRKRKKELGWTNKILAEKSGVPEGTLNKILSGATKYPRRDSIQALRKALELIVVMNEEDGGYPDHVAEAFSYGQSLDGRKNLDDYYALSSDQRVELIDGQIYNMAAPSLNHQMLVLEIAVACREYVRKDQKDCNVYVSPCDVCLDEDDYTMLQPDIFMVCDSRKCQGGIRCNGAPDFVIEIVSENNSKNDYFLKLQKYQNAGVKEYWIVDPIKKRILVYDFWKDMIPTMYTFDDEIQSGFYPGLKINFSEMKKRLL